MSSLKQQPRVRGDQEREMARRERQAQREHASLVGLEPAPKPAPSKTVGPPPRTPVAPPRGPEPSYRRPPRRGFVVIPFLILLSLGAVAVATIALMKTKPTTRLDAQITALTAELNQANAQIDHLRSQVGNAASTKGITHLSRNLAGLRKTVGGMQNAFVPMKAQLTALRTCIPQLQEELTGIGTHVGKHGVTTVGLSPECSTILSTSGSSTAATAGSTAVTH